MSNRSKFLLRLQQVIAYCFFPLLYCVLWGWMVGYQGYRIKNLKAIRRQYRQLRRQLNGPMLLCPNHLTFIDSLIIMWALASPWYYLFHFKQFCWNLPKRSHVAESKLYQAICYVGKCLLIDKDSNKAKKTMAQAQYLLAHGHNVMVFPEGTRSKTGRINTENYVYGVGGLIKAMPNINVMMIYLRGVNQQTMSKMPQRNEQFSLAFKTITPTSEQKGLRAQRDLAQQLIASLCQMEQDYFAANSR